MDYRGLRDALRKQRETMVPMGVVPKLPEGMPPATGAELKDILLEVIRTPLSDRIWYIVDALRLALADLAAIKAGDRVLDAGCGFGGSCLWLAAHRRAETVGVNLCEDAIDAAHHAGNTLEGLVVKDA